MKLTRSPFRNWCRVLGLFVLLVWAAIGSDSWAGTFFWDSDGNPANGQTDGSGNWKDADGVFRWMNAGSDYQWGNGNNAAFGVVGGGAGESYTVTNNLPAYTGSAAKIIFQGASSYTIAGNAWNVIEGVTVNSNVASAQYITAGLTLGQSTTTVTFSNNAASSAGTLTVGGMTANSASSGAKLVLTGTGTGTNQITGNLSQGGSGAVSLLVSGSVWAMTSANSTFKGGATVDGGKLILGHATAFQSATGLLAIAGGQLATSVVVATIGGDLALSSGVMGLNDASAGTLSLSAGKLFTMNGGEWDITLGTAFDKIVGTGTSLFSITGGVLQLDVTGVGFSYNSTYVILDGFASGSVSGLTIGGYDTDHYTASLSDVGVLSFASVPEAGGGSLVLLGLVVMALTRGRWSFLRESPKL